MGAKLYTLVVRPEVLTEGGIMQAERAQVGWDKGRAARWGRSAATRYTIVRTVQGQSEGLAPRNRKRGWRGVQVVR